MSCLFEKKLLWLVVATADPPRGELDSTAVILRKGGRVVLQYSDAIYPVMSVEFDYVAHSMSDRTPEIRGRDRVTVS